MLVSIQVADVNAVPIENYLVYCLLVSIEFLNFAVLPIHAPHWFRGKQDWESRTLKSLHFPSLWWEQGCCTRASFVFYLQLTIPKTRLTGAHQLYPNFFLVW